MKSEPKGKQNYSNDDRIEFERTFKQITPKELCDNFNMFTLVGTDFYVITAGTKSHYNSMIGSGGGWGILFRNPTIWCVMRADRYTLELIQQHRTYTISYFPNEYKERMLFLGSKSGRDSEKMKEVELTGIETNSKNISFKEANLIIECKLIEITTPNFNDFYTPETKEYFSQAYNEAKIYRKYIFGEIINIWVAKKIPV
ncbi:flavin reductase [Bacteroides salyersiae]|uniref:flavin reductase n=1 Tax=Bacteroides salyersiae TaxID=291644 RepID=UPI001D08923A|nr:flavin reductase [Bacteroides salyersiae]MCB6648617.1 flavin reductase [Bacteroides salyersiae]